MLLDGSAPDQDRGVEVEEIELQLHACRRYIQLASEQGEREEVL